MNKLTKWFPDIDGGYYKAVEVDKAIKTLEQQNELLRGVIREHKDMGHFCRDAKDKKLHSVLGEEG